MKELQARFGPRAMRIDSGGTLSSMMLKEGSIDEISVMLGPCIVGGSNRVHFIDPAMSELPSAIALRLRQVEGLENNMIWPNYDVVKRRTR
ncbi:MAG: hypothetical protein GXY70_03825 [Euryarchaeota archaeon]|nr:hypothetical protein [Euryarchaeota archaeon]